MAGGDWYGDGGSDGRTRGQNGAKIPDDFVTSPERFSEHSAVMRGGGCGHVCTKMLPFRMELIDFHFSFKMKFNPSKRS